MTPSLSASPVSFLAPFRVRSFRFQWPADLANSWAIEMETLIFGWYVLVETGSVQLLVLFGALQYLGSLVSPMFGVAADRAGFRRLLCATRALYAVLATILTILAAQGMLSPTYVLALAALAGIVRPSDLLMRHSLIAQTMPPALLLPALGLSRATVDSARMAGALAGAGVVAVFGLVPACVAATCLYVASFALSLGVAGKRSATDAGAAHPPARFTPLQDLRAAFQYVWHKPDLLGMMAMAFTANLLAFPFFLGLLPYVAKNVYLVGQIGLGYMVASFALGGLLGSLVLGSNRFRLRAARTSLCGGIAWFVVILLFAHVKTMEIGLVLLVCAGVVQNLCLTPLAAVMLRGSAQEIRGRVMGMRMLAIWGLPAGLLLSGPLIAALGFTVTAMLYGSIGLLVTGAIVWRWRAQLWRLKAPANDVA